MALGDLRGLSQSAEGLEQSGKNNGQGAGKGKLPNGLFSQISQNFPSAFYAQKLYSFHLKHSLPVFGQLYP